MYRACQFITKILKRYMYYCLFINIMIKEIDIGKILKKNDCEFQMLELT